MKKRKRIVSLFLACMIGFGVISGYSAEASTVNWGNTQLLKGQIGRVTILKTTVLWKLGTSKQLIFSRNLHPGQQYRVYNVQSIQGGLYGLGSGYYVKKNPTYVKYETIAALNRGIPVSNSPSNASIPYVATANLNVRAGASLAYHILGVIKQGSTINVQSKLSNGWYQINYNGKKGFVSGYYVQPVNQSTIFIMNVPLVLQNPELPAGCEVTSLDMALRYKRVNISKLTLAKKMPYTNTLDPNKGYVGSPYNYSGYTINPVKLQGLAKTYRPKSTDLTGVSISVIENEVRKGNPVLVWFTIGYVNVINHYKYQNGHRYWWPQPLHCIVVTGASTTNFYINDPLNGHKNYAINKTRFNEIYSEMGKRALAVR